METVELRSHRFHSLRRLREENKNDGRTSEASALTTCPPNRVRLSEYPQATLTIDRWGELYGATAFGGLQSCTIYAGASGCGVVFKIDSAHLF
jgi:hypothetical protein